VCADEAFSTMEDPLPYCDDVSKAAANPDAERQWGQKQAVKA